MNQEPPIAVVFDLAVELSLLLGAKEINKLDGAYICKVDNLWSFAINGTDRPVAVDMGEKSMGVGALNSFNMAIFYNGWLAGLLDPRGGTICAGEAGNEDNFIKALEERIGAEKLAVEMQS